jgi:diadenosine tetraphosphate (Ap4A) HIT family hydrolase
VVSNSGTAAGQEVSHAHLHVVPRTAGDEYSRFTGRSLVLAAEEPQLLGDHLRQLFLRSTRRDG